MINDLRKELRGVADREKAKHLQRFFKTGPGQYGQGDVFLGITVPDQRAIVKKYKNLAIKDLKEAIVSKFHEERLTALLILVEKFQKSDEPGKKEIFDFYIRNRRGINNWDLVDLTAPKIVGAWLSNKDKSLLYQFAKSKDLWERRIAMLSCFYYICQKDCQDALRVAEILKDDQEDLIQKAVGWMLREIGKRCDKEQEEEFLKKHYQTMPRTMLRYAIERFPEKERKYYLLKK